MKNCVNCHSLLSIKKVMYQESAFSWYITIDFAPETLVSGSDVPGIVGNLVHHFWTAQKALLFLLQDDLGAAVEGLYGYGLC